MSWIRDFLLKLKNFKMKINLISIIYKIFVYGLFVYLVGILDFGYLLGFDFHKCKYAQLHVFFSPNLHAPCTPRFRFYFFFVIGFNFVGLFNLSLLDFCTCYFSFTSWLCQLLQLHYLISSYPNYVFAFIFYFSFWVVCGSQCHSWNDCVWASYYSVSAST